MSAEKMIEELRKKDAAWQQLCDEWTEKSRSLEGFDEAIWHTVRRTVEREAADLLSATQADNERLRKALEEVSAAIGGVRFMDPPDGGDVSLGEQVRRMRHTLDATEADMLVIRNGIVAARGVIVALIEQEYNAETWGLHSLLAVVDAALAARSALPEQEEGK